MKKRVREINFDKLNINQKIKKSFKGVSREGGISLQEANVIDEYGSDIAKKNARKKDIDTSWEEVFTLLEKEEVDFDNLMYLDPIGLRYYLPAYMLYSVENKTSSLDVTDHILFILEYIIKDFDKRNIDILSKDQKKTIKYYLLYIAEHSKEELDREQAYNALKAGWNIYNI